ncbi:MAG: hypothetical protein KBI41_12725, partial [Kiritimatiellae bacterium]|nr:hypothetical protein [Kiritimatiellia bacterium]
MVAMFVFGGTAVVLECAAYDNIICPMCGQRLVTPFRESFTKENRKRFNAIYKRLPIKRGPSNRKDTVGFFEAVTIRQILDTEGVKGRGAGQRREGWPGS